MIQAIRHMHEEDYIIYPAKGMSIFVNKRVWNTESGGFIALLSLELSSEINHNYNLEQPYSLTLVCVDFTTTMTMIDSATGWFELH